MSETADTAPQHSVRVSVRGLRKSYAGQPVLQGIDFDVARSETFVISQIRSFITDV